MATFSPKFKQTSPTIALSATTTTSSAAIGDGTNVLVTNEGPNTVFFDKGGASITATTASIPLVAGAQVVVGRNSSDSFIAVITATGTASVYVTPGEGE